MDFFSVLSLVMLNFINFLVASKISGFIGFDICLKKINKSNTFLFLECERCRPPFHTFIRSTKECALNYFLFASEMLWWGISMPTNKL